MDKYELLSIVGDLIGDNSGGDEEAIPGVEDVMENVGPKGTEDVTIQFTDGKAIRITAEEI